MSITIQELKKEKLLLQYKIKKEIMEFKVRTGVLVRDITVKNIDATSIGQTEKIIVQEVVCNLDLP